MEKNREAAEEAVKQVEKELKDKKVAEIKKLILATLEMGEVLKKRIAEDQEALKILELDLKDLKEGRLDRIEERQKIMPKAKEISVIHVERIVEEHHHHHHDYTPVVIPVVKENHWYDPYRVWYGGQPYAGDSIQPVVFNTCDLNVVSGAGATVGISLCTVNNSIVKDAFAGAYELNDGTVKLIA